MGPKPVRAEPSSVSGETARPESGGRERCMITIGAKPWAEVLVDGKNTGKITPLVDHELPCGKHRITFKNSELNIEKTEVISVKAGEKFKKVFQLVDPEE